MASGQLRLFALITLVVANVAPCLSTKHDSSQVVRRLDPPTLEIRLAQAWSQVDPGFFEVTRHNYFKSTTSSACVCPFWMPFTHSTIFNHREFRVTGSSMSERVCGLLRQGKRCDPEKSDGISKEPTNIIVTGFAPVDSWGVCRPPSADSAEPPGPGLCYYWDHNLQEVRKEISCWQQKLPATQPERRIIPMVPLEYEPNKIKGCQSLRVNYEPETDMMNAGQSARAEQHAQAQQRTHAQQRVREWLSTKPGGSARAGESVHSVGVPSSMGQISFQKLRELLHTEATGPGSTMCPPPNTIMSSGFAFPGTRISSFPEPFRFLASISCVLLEENLCALIRRGASCTGSELHKKDPNLNIPITVTGFMLGDKPAFTCKKPVLTPTTGEVPALTNPIGHCCFIGDLQHMQDQTTCLESNGKASSGLNRKPAAASGKPSKRPNTPAKGPPSKIPKHQ